MAGQLDSLFKNVAKSVVSQFGDSLIMILLIQKKHLLLITHLQEL